MKNTDLTNSNIEVDTLLDLTTAINCELGEAALMKIYLFTLIGNFKIDNLLVYEFENDVWIEKLRHGIDKQYYAHSEELTQVLEYKNFLDFKNTEFRTLNHHFDFSIPILKDNKLFACILFGFKENIADNVQAIKFIQTISNILFVAIQNSRFREEKIKQETIKNELKIARRLQSLLFPQTLPYSDNLKIHATYIPHQSVGGDYYDYIQLPDHDFIVCIADVSGKGISAAFIMSSFQAALRVLARQGMRLEEIVKELNTLVYNNTKGEKFVTFFIAKYIPRKNMILYINCGHNAPILISEQLQIEFLDKGSTILGTFPALPFIETGKIYNVSNSVLFAYTDGLVECFEKTDTDQGVEIITDILLSNTDINLLHNTILNKMDIHHSAFDDITMMSCYFSNQDQE